jgi:hypothetical protein
LQFDHYPQPFAKGGKHQPENLRHACFQHNQKAAMQAGLHFLAREPLKSTARINQVN